MKLSTIYCLIILGIVPAYSIAQNVQLHYDFRHTLDPGLNEKNFPMVSFEYFKEFDSLGSFLFKAQSFLNGKKYNVGETFIQFSQSLKFWNPTAFLSLNYSGGLGVAGTGFGYHISSAYAVGIAVPLEWKGVYLTWNAQYRYTAFHTASHDVQLIFYLWKGMLDYRLVLAGSIVSWTENRNQGTEFTSHLSGKKFAFFGDTQLWYQLEGGFSLGTRINLYYNVLGGESNFKVYPTLGMQYKF